MDDLNKKMMGTSDLNKERLRKLKELFPDLFTIEGKLNLDELKKIDDPELVKESERFEFRWFGKGGAKRNAFTPSRATLMYDEKSSVHPEHADGNMIIEGENLETLKVLLSAYRESVKCIYIDPPYNTGKDFVYSDKWDESKQDYWAHIGVVDDQGIKLESNPEASGRFHSNWLNMMYPRLLLARQLLREDGVIFISIDDNEVHHLRAVMDEVFGEENFVANFVWNSTKSITNPALVSVSHTYNFAYAKEKSLYDLHYRAHFKLPAILEGFKNLDNDPRGKWKADPFEAGGTRPNQMYAITNPNTKEVFYPNEGNCWKNNFNRFKKLLEESRIVFGQNGKGRPQRKRFIWEAEKRGQTPNTWWDDVGTTTSGTIELKNIFEKKLFDNPKPTSLIKRIIQLATDKDAIILDSFSGSGTTMHAVMALNKEDGGNRKCILVQVSEATGPQSEAHKAGYKKISDITIERNKRAIQKLEEETTKQASLTQDEQKPFKAGFKVYRLAKSNFPRVDFAPDPTKTEEENLALLDKYIAAKETALMAKIDTRSIFDEVLLKNGFMLNYQKEKEPGFSRNDVYRIKDRSKECLICMDIKIYDDTWKKELQKHKDTFFICLARALQDTTAKWNLRHLLGEKLIAI